MRKGFCPKATACRTKEGELITDGRGRMERWREFFSNHLNNNNKDNNNNEGEERGAEELGQQERMTEEGDEVVEPPTRMEIAKAIKMLNNNNNNKAPGVDNLSGKLFKVGSVEVQQQMESLLNQIWNEKRIPKEWKMGVICPIYKKGDKT